MARQLVAQGTSDVDRFKEIVARQPGEGVTVMELDVPDKFVIPYFFDLPFGSGLDDLLPLIDRAIEEIPGVHLVGASTYTVRNGLGTFRIQVRTNPLPVLGILVGAAVIGILGIFGVVGWRIYRFDLAEFANEVGVGGIFKLALGGSLFVFALALLGLGAVLFLRRSGAL